MIDVELLLDVLIVLAALVFGIVGLTVGIAAARNGSRPGGLHPVTLIGGGVLLLAAPGAGLLFALAAAS